MANFTKKCTGPCGRELPATEEYFYRGAGGRFGLMAMCKQCKRAKRHEYVVSPHGKQKSNEYYRRPEVKEKRRKQQRLFRATETRRDYMKQYRATPAGKSARALSANRRRARKCALPSTFTSADWQRCLDYWHGCCAYCGRQANGLFAQVHQEHFIPFTSPDCPGTVPWNMLPACDVCNLGKNNREPRAWVIEKFGKRKGAAILKRIDEYFGDLKP